MARHLLRQRRGEELPLLKREPPTHEKPGLRSALGVLNAKEVIGDLAVRNHSLLAIGYFHAPTLSKKRRVFFSRL